MPEKGNRNKFRTLLIAGTPVIIAVTILLVIIIQASNSSIYSGFDKEFSLGARDKLSFQWKDLSGKETATATQCRCIGMLRRYVMGLSWDGVTCFGIKFDCRETVENHPGNVVL